jgi:hypothetical protein
MTAFSIEETNGTPAFAGVTVLFKISILNKNSRHAREGGHPVFCLFDKLWSAK